MSIKSQFQTQYAYHWHTTNRLMDCAAKLEESVYKEEPDHSLRSIHALLFHLLGTDYGWRRGLETGRQPDPLSEGDFPTLAALQTGFAQEQAAWEAMLESLSEAELTGDITLTPRRGNAMTFPRWRILQHIILHGMQHHAELAYLLTDRGQSPGDIDFIFFA